jgi:hypothetical protein
MHTFKSKMNIYRHDDLIQHLVYQMELHFHFSLFQVLCGQVQTEIWHPYLQNSLLANVFSNSFHFSVSDNPSRKLLRESRIV